MLAGKASVTSIAFQTLASLLETDGLSVLSNGAVTTQTGYLKNTNTSINLFVGTGSTLPTTYVTVIPTDSLQIASGTNLNQVWVKSASSTVVVNFAEGAVYSNSSINGVIGDITATEGQVPKADADGNLVASSISDDATTVSIDSDLEVTGSSLFDSTITVTGGVDLNGATSGTTVLQATAIAGSHVITLPAATDTLVGKDTTDTMTNKTLTAPVINAATIGTSLKPTSNDGAPLGDATHNFSDLFMAAGAVVNYANGDTVLTHSTGILTLGTGELRITTPGTNAASVVTLSSSQTLTSKGLTGPTLNGGAALGSTSTEIDQFNDVSAYQESIIAAGAITITKKYSGLALVGAGAVTLAAPGATMLGQIKVIEMTTDNGDVTLALTNVEGQSSGTTATFNDVSDALVLIAAASKWIVLKEFGITLS